MTKIWLKTEKNNLPTVFASYLLGHLLGHSNSRKLDLPNVLKELELPTALQEGLEHIVAMY